MSNIKKVSERASGALTMNFNSLPTEERQQIILNQILKIHKKNKPTIKLTTQTLQDIVVHEILVTSMKPDFPVMSVVDLYIRKLNVKELHKRVLRYENVCR